MDLDEKTRKAKELGPWFHSIEIAPGIWTRELYPSAGPQPQNHPLARWKVFESEIPTDLTGLRVLDIGSADGFFSIEMARRGAQVTAHDAAGKMIKRLEFAAECLGLQDKITGKVGFVHDLPEGEAYDVVLCLGLLYHLRHPFLDLERLSKSSDLLFLESAVDPGKKPYLYLKPPQEGVHHIPKWFPTESCISDMLHLLGFTDIKNLNDPNPGRASFVLTVSGIHTVDPPQCLSATSLTGLQL